MVGTKNLILKKYIYRRSIRLCGVWKMGIENVSLQSIRVIHHYQCLLVKCKRQQEKLLSPRHSISSPRLLGFIVLLCKLKRNELGKSPLRMTFTFQPSRIPFNVWTSHSSVRPLMKNSLSNTTIKLCFDFKMKDKANFP